MYKFYFFTDYITNGKKVIFIIFFECIQVTTEATRR